MKRRCGHEVKIPCKVKTSSLPPCKEMCIVTSPLCGHDIEVPCHSVDAMQRWKPWDAEVRFNSHVRSFSRVPCEPMSSCGPGGHGAFETRGAARPQATRNQHAARAARACEDLQEDTSSLGLIFLLSGFIFYHVQLDPMRNIRTMYILESQFPQTLHSSNVESPGG